MLQLMRETLTWSSRPLLEWQWWAPTRLGDSSLWTFSRDSVIKLAISSGRIGESHECFRDPQSWNTVPVSSNMAKSSNSSMRFSQQTTPPLTPWIAQLVMFDYPIMFPFNSIQFHEKFDIWSIFLDRKTSISTGWPRVTGVARIAPEAVKLFPMANCDANMWRPGSALEAKLGFQSWGSQWLPVTMGFWWDFDGKLMFSAG